MKRRKHKEQTNGWNVEDSAHGRLKTRKTNAVMTDPYAELGLEGKWTLKDYFLAALIVLILHQINRHVLYTLFENAKHFSHLSQLEREMMYRTEMGLYYSYFKSMIEAPTVAEGIRSMTHDNLTEYPTTINALQRFNLLPEILVGLLYKVYLGWCDVVSCPFNQICFRVNRGQALPPVTSCEGLGVPIYFYTHSAFELNALLAPLTFMIAAVVTGSVGAGVVAALAFLYNFGEATRVMWTPPLRETWTFPIIHLHLFLVTCMLKFERQLGSLTWSKGSLLCQLGIFITTFYSVASWQFCHFNLSVFIIAVSALFALQLISQTTFLRFLIPTTLGFGSLLSLMHENKMMLTSTMLMTIASSWILLAFQRQQSQKVLESLLYRMVAPFCVLVNSVILKSMVTNLLNISDEMHILNILKSKFTDFRDFHTLLYLCAKEFDFIGVGYFELMTASAVLPMALIASLLIVIQLFVSMFCAGEKRQQLFGVSFQLKPVNMCKAVVPKVPLGYVRLSMLGVAVLTMSCNGYPNLNKAMSRQGEYNDPELEQLLNWIMDNTGKEDSFAGSMSTMATIRLTTGRPIVNHPHYEDSLARERNKQVYRAFARFAPEDIHATMHALQAKYLLLEVGWCWAKRPVGCSIAEAFDYEYPHLKGRQATCIAMRTNPHPFRTVFQNSAFVLLKT
ncbi:protein C-mannosyl-transferase DPY19L1-like isoform X2 [Symsagittifera roscoffensis]|uniref:protein C-mannosyl-transferase DPY19L1-like isoform X2 n=1 Tax=Symsagittifera roscoffensis TaxID=84072 RepID=UPI00307BB3AA